MVDMSVLTKRSSMAFFSDGRDHYSHRVRIVLAEKGVTVDIIECDPSDVPQEVTDLNPYNNLPTLLDRDLILYESKVMMEYLDERFPHPPLLPVYPVLRGQCRLWMHRIERDWCDKIDMLQADTGTAAKQDAARKELRDSLTGIAPIFAEKPFFMHDEFTLVDCCLAPILWRLPMMGVELPKTKQVKPLLEYMERMFATPSFQTSLSEQEQEMR